MKKFYMLSALLFSINSYALPPPDSYYGKAIAIEVYGKKNSGIGLPTRHPYAITNHSDRPKTYIVYAALCPSTPGCVWIGEQIDIKNGESKTGELRINYPFWPTEAGTYKFLAITRVGDVDVRDEAKVIVNE